MERQSVSQSVARSVRMPSRSTLTSASAVSNLTGETHNMPPGMVPFGTQIMPGVNIVAVPLEKNGPDFTNIFWSIEVWPRRKMKSIVFKFTSLLSVSVMNFAPRHTVHNEKNWQTFGTCSIHTRAFLLHNWLMQRSHSDNLTSIHFNGALSILLLGWIVTDCCLSWQLYANSRCKGSGIPNTSSQEATVGEDCLLT